MPIALKRENTKIERFDLKLAAGQQGAKGKAEGSRQHPSYFAQDNLADDARLSRGKLPRDGCMNGLPAILVEQLGKNVGVAGPTRVQMMG